MSSKSCLSPFYATGADDPLEQLEDDLTVTLVIIRGIQNRLTEAGGLAGLPRFPCSTPVDGEGERVTRRERLDAVREHIDICLDDLNSCIDNLEAFRNGL